MSAPAFAEPTCIEADSPLLLTTHGRGGLVPIHSRAVWSPCSRYRYLLERRWDSAAPVCWVMCNPSTANAEANDPTLERCQRFSAAWGYGGMVVVNLFAWRATDPQVMRAAADPVGPDNDRAIATYAADVVASGGLVVCAWGNHGLHRERSTEVVEQLLAASIPLHCLTVTDQGEPGHPLYLAKTLTPRRWL